MGKILIIGYPYWADVTAGMLQAGGLEAAVWRPGPEDVPAALRWCRPVRWVWYLMDRRFREAAVIHYVGVVSSRLFLRMARCLGKRIILHWVGSDVLPLQEAAAKGNERRLRFFRRVPAAHFADSPEIIAELAALGIRAELFRLLPDSVLPKAEAPLPERPAVLAYWSHERRKFYGGEIVDALADEFPDVPFLVVGSDGRDEPQHPNMTYLGRLGSLEEVYRQVSVLVRLPEHDSLSAMVLEMLGRGRQVIYNRPFPHAELASTLNEAREALRRCLARRDKNTEGRQYVGEHFSVEAESRRVASLYRRVFDNS